jgi:hypothetical protein
MRSFWKAVISTTNAFFRIIGIATFLCASFAAINPVWRPHSVRMLARIWKAYLSTEGSSTVGMVSGIIAGLLFIIITVFVVLRYKGRDEMTRYWREEARVAISAYFIGVLLLYGSVFLFKVLDTVYNDHAQEISALVGERQTVTDIANKRDEWQTRANPCFDILADASVIEQLVNRINQDLAGNPSIIFATTLTDKTSPVLVNAEARLQFILLTACKASGVPTACSWEGHPAISSDMPRLGIGVSIYGTTANTATAANLAGLLQSWFKQIHFIYSPTGVPASVKQGRDNMIWPQFGTTP